VTAAAKQTRKKYALARIATRTASGTYSERSSNTMGQ